MELGQGREEEKKVLRCIDDYIIEQSAWLCHRFENNRGSDFA